MCLLVGTALRRAAVSRFQFLVSSFQSQKHKRKPSTNWKLGTGKSECRQLPDCRLWQRSCSYVYGKAVMETEIIAAGICEKRSDVATAEEMSRLFLSQRQELTWLAEFLNGDEQVAQACVTDAFAIASGWGQFSEVVLMRFTQLATISSALVIQQARLAQLASVYERRACLHRNHPYL